MLDASLFIFGLVIGSFLNVCIYRLPLGLSIVAPPSHCMQCGTRLKALDMIPILSYLLLGGRCHYCGQPYSPRYTVVELLTGIMFVWCLHVIGLSGELFEALIFVCFLLMITFIDLDHQLILDKVLLPFAGMGLLINLITGLVGWQDMLIAAAGGGAVILLIAVISRGGMGGGDIKFVASLGLWLGWHLLIINLFLSFILGGVIGVLLLLFKIKKRKDYIPFGPFLAIGGFIAMLYGFEILRWYYLGNMGR